MAGENLVTLLKSSNGTGLSENHLAKPYEQKRKIYWDFPGGSVLRLHTPNVGGPGSIPGEGTRSRMLQLSSYAATEDPACQLVHDAVK